MLQQQMNRSEAMINLMGEYVVRVEKLTENANGEIKTIKHCIENGKLQENTERLPKKR